MKEYVVDHVIDCSPERYWVMWLDPDFARALLLDGLGYLDCTIEPVRSAGASKLRDMVVSPKVAIPKALRRAVGDRLVYAERGRLDTVAGRWTYDLSMPSFAAFSGQGEVRLAPLPDGRCTRTTRMAFTVKMPMIGGRIEATALENARTELDRGAAFVNRWLKDYG